MSSKNLTRDEARARAHKVRVQHYDVALDVTADAPTFGSLTTVDFEALTDGDTFIDLRDADINSVYLDGTDITTTACRGDKNSYNSDDGLIVPLSTGTHTLVVDARCRYTTTGQGLHRFVDPADEQTYMYTQFETADAKRVFACFDQPDMKATWSLRVAAPAEWTVVSNSAPVITDTDDATRSFSFDVPMPLSTYLIAFCIGPWHEVHDQWRGEVTPHPEIPAEHLPDGPVTIDLGLFCRQSIAEHLDAATLFRETKQGFDFYAKNFGEPYPFGKYDQIFCPEFNMGAMENAGCVTIRDEYVFRSRTTGYRYERRNDTLLHEMAHMWFGDLVTMQWWDDLWLNESFATWSAAAAQVAVSDYRQAWTTFANVEKSWAYQQDELPSTHPIAADAGDIDTVEQNFDGITYAKGASVLKQLAAYVGEDAFLAGARLHFARHRFGNATFDDLLSAMSETSGRDLSNWADQWLNTTGLPTLGADFTIDNGTYTSFAITQSGAQPGNGELRDHRIAVGIYQFHNIDGQQVLRRVHREEIDITSRRTEVAALVGSAAGDLVLVNDDDLTYARMNLDERSLATVIDHIGAITDPMPRTLCWSAAWQMVRHGELRAREFMNLVLGGSGDEDQIAVLERVLSQAITAVTRYADPDWATRVGIPALAHGFLASARAAEPGSDTQLAHINALAQVPLASVGEPVVDVFRAILRGEPETVGLSGLVSDCDMRWRALTTLIAAGFVADPATDIAALAAEDNSAQGVQSATQARASRPTSEAKATTWSAITSRGESAPSNLALRHLSLGFTAPGAGELLTQHGYTDRYFDEAVQWWQDYPSDTALRMLEGLYPMWDISDKAVTLASDVLTDPNTPAPVRRILSEGRDHIKRALRARAIDRG